MDLSERDAIDRAGGVATRHPWEDSRASFLVAQLRRRVPFSGPIVDVGCGDAYVLSRLRGAFPEVGCFGVDTAYGAQVDCPEGVFLCASLDDLPAAASPAGVVLLMDVLEHVADPVALLQELRQRGVLGPDSWLFVTVPAWQFLFCRQDEWLGHYRRYRLGLLSDHLGGAGVRVVESGYFFLSLLLVRMLEVALERLGWRRSTATGLVGWRGGARLSGGLSACLSWDARVCGYLRQCTGLTVPGLSCFAVGRLA